jgi:hypothetical protein
MADTPLDIFSTDPEVLGLQRQRQLANLLTGQAFNQPQGQMISGHYVKPSALQQALPMINAAIGGLTNANLDTKQQELATALRQQKADAYTQFQELMAKPETRGQAIKFAASNQYLQPLAAELMKGMKLGEGEKYVMPNLEGGAPVELASGGAKYHAPLQIDTGTTIEIRDPLDPTKVLQRLPKSQMPTAGQVVETANGPMLVNTRTGQAMPVMGAGGQPIAPKLTAEQTKDITSINQQNATIDGALKAVKATPNAFSFQRGMAQDLPSGETLAGRVDTPEQAAARAYVFNNVSAVIKERAGTAQSAGELQRLNSFMPGPKDNAQQIENKLNGFKQYLTDLEKGTRQNPNVPTQQTPQAPAAPVQRAYMGAEPIVVKNGKWVYEKTGKAVE